MNVTEIFSQIASHLSVADLKRVSCVCKRWYTLVEALGRTYYDEVIVGFHAASNLPLVGILRYDGSLQIIPDFERGLGIILHNTKFNFPETISIEDNIHEHPTVLLLKRLKRNAEHYLGRRVTKAVLTVPSCFGALKRKRVVKYIQEAGLELVRLVNTTTVIAIAYEHQFSHTKETNSLVLSFGGGFLCASLIRFEEGLIEVLAHHGIALDFDTDSKNGDEPTSTQRDCISETISLCLESAKLNKNAIQEVILNGGPTNSSAVEEMIGNMFNLKPVLFNSGLEILRGTAIYAYMLQQKGLNPTISKTINSLFVIDVCSHSLGLETAGAVMSLLIPRNTSLPAKKELTFTTYADNACGIPLSVYEGENSSTRDNHKVAEYDLLGVLPAPRGVPRIQITFHLDASGVFSISGVEREGTKPLTFVEKPLPNFADSHHIHN